MTHPLTNRITTFELKINLVDFELETRCPSVALHLISLSFGPLARVVVRYTSD